MIKIARGTTGQADVYDGWVDICALANGSASGDWDLIDQATMATVASYYQETTGYTGQAGWGITASGMITVPNDAAPGTYRGMHWGAECWDPELMEPNARITNIYEFEVVCMKIALHGLVPIAP